LCKNPATENAGGRPSFVPDVGICARSSRKFRKKGDMDYFDTQKSLVATLILIAGIAAICLLLWLLNKLLRRFGVREHHVDRMGSSMLEMERMFRPSAEHVITARQKRKATKPRGDDDPPKAT
jgi:hypothetical protein